MPSTARSICSRMRFTCFWLPRASGGGRIRTAILSSTLMPPAAAPGPGSAAIRPGQCFRRWLRSVHWTTSNACHHLTRWIAAQQWPTTHDSSLLLHGQVAKSAFGHKIQPLPPEEIRQMVTMLPGLNSMYSGLQLQGRVGTLKRTLIHDPLLSLQMQLPEARLCTGIYPVLSAPFCHPILW